MHPVILRIGTINIYSYGLLLAVAFFTVVPLISRQAIKYNINRQQIWDICFVAVIFGILGSRLFYVAENIRFYLTQPLEIFKLYHGGLSWFGGLLSGSLATIFYLKKKRLNVYKILDIFAPYLALAQAIGRIGCFLNGCCYGKPSFYCGLYFPVHQAYLIPTQLYSSLLLIAIFIILRFLLAKPHKDGLIIYIYLILYAIKRFFIEFWRAEGIFIVAGLTLFQIISLCIFIYALLNIIRLKLYKRN